MSNQRHTVDRARVLGRLDEISRIGALENGGVCRLALAPEETQARARLIGWAQDLGCVVFADAIGNLFLRFGDAGSKEPPVLVGSHLDTQPVGGNFDGVLGVIAALECVEILAAQSDRAFGPVEIAIWCNEEGARFSPTTMGAAVHAGHFPLAAALATTDAGGQSVTASLQQAMTSLCAAGISPAPRDLAANYKAYVELHIEQGPVLEKEGCAIGIVTDIQGLVQYKVEVLGTAGHAGAVPMEGREDALTRARALLADIDKTLAAFEGLRFTVGRLDVAPGSINTIPARAEFTLDVRHPEASILARAAEQIELLCAGAQLTRLIHQTPVPFDKRVATAIESATRRLGLSSRRIVSGATHDAAHVAALCPAGMIFVPCRGGISHNENEYCAPEHVIQGTQVLADTVMALAERRVQ
ncbi:Zn-dependent hydrolase [Mesorhizobium loti]|nr:M20 family metallo-hydrolase [Mesorhizobium loti]PLP55582.1 Zn-dependent hydrolase [Mesorhizobium loti]